ncbi:MAG: PKD domain-containing protein [Bacteroidota bacterium]|nr:PKD domain-containing protein [Bacteroidota bacterium]
MVEYRWNFGEPESGAGNTSILPNPTHEYMEPGSYTVSLEAMDQEGCWQTIYRQVDVGFLPQVDFGWESFICDSAVYFDDLSSGNGKPIDFWVWDYGDGSPMDTIFAPDDPDVSHVYAFGGEYNVTLLVQNTGGCADTLSQTVFREYCINANFAVIDTLLCQGFELSFSDSSIYADIITSWQWNFGDGADTAYVNHAPIITHTYPDAGTYQVSLVIFSSVGGVDISDTLTKNVTVLPTPSRPSPCRRCVWVILLCSLTFQIPMVRSCKAGTGSLLREVLMRPQSNATRFTPMRRPTASWSSFW